MLETRGTASEARRDCCKPGGDALRPGNRRADDDGVGAQIEGAAEIRRGLDSSLEDHRNGTLAHQVRQQIPRGAYQPGAGWCVASQSRRDRIDAGGDGLPRLPDGGDVGEHRQSKLAADAPHEHRPGFAERGVSIRAVDCNDRGPGLGQRARRCEVRGDKNLVLVIALAQADDRVLRQAAKGANVVDTFAAKATRATTQHRGSDPAERGRVIQRIAFRRLAGDDQTITQLFRKGQAEMFPGVEFSLKVAPLRL